MDLNQCISELTELNWLYDNIKYMYAPMIGSFLGFLGALIILFITQYRDKQNKIYEGIYTYYTQLNNTKIEEANQIIMYKDSLKYIKKQNDELFKSIFQLQSCDFPVENLEKNNLKNKILLLIKQKLSTKELC